MSSLSNLIEINSSFDNYLCPYDLDSQYVLSGQHTVHLKEKYDDVYQNIASHVSRLEKHPILLQGPKGNPGHKGQAGDGGEKGMKGNKGYKGPSGT